MTDPSIEHLLESLDFSRVDAEALAALSQAGIDVTNPQPDETAALSSPQGTTEDRRFIVVPVACTPLMLGHMRAAHDLTAESLDELTPAQEIMWVVFDELYHVLVNAALKKGWVFE